MVAVGVDNHRVAVIPAHGSVFDDPRDTPFNEIWNEPYLRETCLCNHSKLLSKSNSPSQSSYSSSSICVPVSLYLMCRVDSNCCTP